MHFILVMFFFFKQKTAYEMRISDWSSDVCSSDLVLLVAPCAAHFLEHPRGGLPKGGDDFAPRTLGDRIEPHVDLVARITGFFARRSEERRVGKECVSTCRSRWSPYH